MAAEKGEEASAQVAESTGVDPMSVEATDMELDSLIANLGSGGDDGPGIDDGDTAEDAGSADDPASDSGSEADSEEVEKEAEEPTDSAEEVDESAETEGEGEEDDDDEKRPENKEEMDNAFKALTRKRQKIKAREEAVKTRAAELEQKYAPVIKDLEQRHEVALGHARKAVETLKMLERDPLPALEALGWTVPRLAHLVGHGKPPEDLEQQFHQKDAAERERAIREANEQSQATAERLRQLEFQQWRRDVIPKVISDVADEMEEGDYPALATLREERRADIVLDEMIKARRAGRDLDMSEALGIIEKRLAQDLDLDKVRARQDGSKQPEKKRKVAKLPSRENAPARAKVSDSYGGVEDELATLDQLIAKNS